MLSRLKPFLTHPLVRGLDIDAPETNKQIARMVQEKAFLKKIYKSWYLEIKRIFSTNMEGKIIELGSGGGFLKDFMPNLMTSEILKVPDVDLILDACRLPFKQNSLKGLAMIDVFHHIPDVETFLSESTRCIKPGGVIVMIEPWITQWSKIVFSHFHHEPVDIATRHWKLNNKGGPLSLANSALPWIVFQRDRNKFESVYPEWNIKKIRLHTPFSYLLSGGVSLKSLLPEIFYNPCHYVEYLLTPIMHKIAMFATITLERQA